MVSFVTPIFSSNIRPWKAENSTQTHEPSIVLAAHVSCTMVKHQVIWLHKTQTILNGIMSKKITSVLFSKEHHFSWTTFPQHTDTTLGKQAPHFSKRTYINDIYVPPLNAYAWRNAVLNKDSKCKSLLPSVWRFEVFSIKIRNNIYALFQVYREWWLWCAKQKKEHYWTKIALTR
jgi:hypothetical protein